MTIIWNLLSSEKKEWQINGGEKEREEEETLRKEKKQGDKGKEEECPRQTE